MFLTSFLFASLSLSANQFSQEHIDGLLGLGAPKLAKFLQRANTYVYYYFSWGKIIIL